MCARVRLQAFTSNNNCCAPARHMDRVAGTNTTAIGSRLVRGKNRVFIIIIIVVMNYFSVHAHAHVYVYFFGNVISSSIHIESFVILFFPLKIIVPNEGVLLSRDALVCTASSNALFCDVRISFDNCSRLNPLNWRVG